MYKCLDCGHITEELQHYTETHGLDYPPYEETDGCPICGGYCEEIEPCKICGEYEEVDEHGYCKECKNRVLKTFRNFVDETFSEEERELLNIEYEGEWI